MAKNNKKQIKKLRKIHILPHIILLLFFMAFFSIIAVAFTEVFFNFLVENHLSESYERAQKIAERIEKQNMNNDITGIQIDVAGGEDFGIFDNTKGTFVIEPKQKFDRSSFITYQFGDNTIYFDNFDDQGLGLIEGKTFNSFDVIRRYIADTRLNLSSNTENEIVASLHGWVDQSIAEGKYSVYYSTDLVIKNKDMQYIIFFIGAMVIAVLVPLLFYIITLCISVVGQKRSSRLIYYDTLTGGNNWLFFKEKVDRILKTAWLFRRNYAIVSLHMERYQSLCACYGVMAGEEIITQMNKVIGKSVKGRKESFARYTEAEFGLLLVMDSKEQLTQRIENIITNLTVAMEPRKIEYTVGLCEIGAGGNPDDLYSNASIARKNIPDSATDKIAWFNEKLKEDQLWERFVEENMERALEAGELHVYLQPKYNAETHQLGGAEALIRWISPTEGFIGPGKFIPIFEKNGFITRIDDFMLSSVAALQAQWIKEGHKVVPISVNVSRAHFAQEDLAEHICEIVEKAGAPKEVIELELTESAFFEDKEMLINTVEKLKDMGFAVSMDDFGAGYSSLNSLKDLRLDVLKIDADFFRGKEENEERGSLIVAQTIHLAKNLGMTTVAEGIESGDQVDFLAKNGCDLIQGFYFAKPMPIEDYIVKMDEGKAAI